jgi:hypothetical protein
MPTTDPWPLEDLPAGGQNDQQTERLKRASRLIVTSREKMPHSAQWHLALRRTLWRYTQEVLFRRGRGRPDGTAESKEKPHDA